MLTPCVTSNFDKINCEVVNPFHEGKRVSEEVLLKLCAGANWEHDAGM